MAKLNTMTAKLAEQSAKRKAELAATVGEIKGEGTAPVVEDAEPKKAPKAAPRKKATTSKPKEAPKAAPVAVEEDEVDYEEKRGRKKKYQSKDPRHPTTVVFSESQYQRVRKYAFEHNMGISDVLIEAFAQMTGED